VAGVIGRILVVCRIERIPVEGVTERLLADRELRGIFLIRPLERASMEKVSIHDVEPSTWDPENRTHDRRGLTEPLNTSDVSIVHYVLEPGERFSESVHAHMDQEEVFVVVEGEATFALRDEGDEVTVGENEAIRFAPGEFQSGKNDSDETVVAFGLGAPRHTEDVRISRIPTLDESVECPECGRGDMRIPAEEDSGLVCPDCGAELKVE
jgi:mannose-6-phosphate isomerase-like protein (cupin superfamily)